MRYRNCLHEVNWKFQVKHHYGCKALCFVLFNITNTGWNNCIAVKIKETVEKRIKMLWRCIWFIMNSMDLPSIEWYSKTLGFWGGAVSIGNHPLNQSRIVNGFKCTVTGQNCCCKMQVNSVIVSNLIHHVPLPVNRPFYSCLLSDLASEWQWGWRWPCFETDLCHCFCCVNQVVVMLIRCIYQNKVTSSFAAIQRPGLLAHDCKMTFGTL